MCGICGFVGPCENPDEVIDRMTEVITHRGPDDVGVYADENIHMGFRRLSIIDLGSGHQPIFNEDRTKVLTFNGEIYNYRELREELIASGHDFTTQTDSEVLLHGYEQWGPDLLERLRGMWCFAIYDIPTGGLFIARDRFGIKPCHYAMVGDTFVYGSEIKSILEFPAYERRFNESALDSYLSFQYVIPPETLFAGIYALLPGSYLIYRAGKVTTTRYWEATFDIDESISEEEAVDRIDEVFTKSVEAHRIADVEVGCFLSSGVDSSWVASYFGGQRTFTVGFDVGDKYDETTYAEPLAEKIGTTQYSKTITAEEYFAIFPKAQWYFDQPLADPSAIALYFVSRVASEQVKVVLSGEGADELFGGYRAYHEPLDRERTREGTPKVVRGALAGLSKALPAAKRNNRYVRSMHSVEETYGGDGCGHGGTLLSVDEKRAILKGHPDGCRSTAEILAPYYARYRGCDDQAKMQLLDIDVWMVGDILLKADRMSMANSLELRVPFLDREVWALARTLPVRLRVNDEGGHENTKYAMRKAAERHLPEATAQKPKLGFPTPIRVWLKDERWHDEVVSCLTGEGAARFFDIDALKTLIDEHVQGVRDNSRRIWTIYSFLVWYRVYFEGGDEAFKAAERAVKPAGERPASEALPNVRVITARGDDAPSHGSAVGDDGASAR